MSRDQRQLGDALAKGKLAVALGVSFYTLEGFLTANLPVKELPKIREGLPSSNGSGVIGVVKNPPHPHAAKRVFSDGAAVQKEDRNSTSK